MYVELHNFEVSLDHFSYGFIFEEVLQSHITMANMLKYF